MTGTPRTVTYLENTSFPLSGPVSGITPQQMQDFVATSAPNIAGIDDPQNASGLGAPAIIRGTVYAHLAAGVTVGAGQTTGVRQATATGLQNAVNYASANGKYFDIEPNVYEINSSTGLVTPAGQTINWHGSRESNIVQFYAGGSGAPILTIGDATGATATGGVELDGAFLTYGVDQTGLTNANGLVIGTLGLSDLRNIRVGTVGTTPINPAYRGIYIPSSFFFSNSLTNIQVSGAQQWLCDFAGISGSTGNVFRNIYLQGAGSSFYGTLGGGAINLALANVATENIFDQLNVEWCILPQVMPIQNCFGLHINGFHLEGVKISGFGSPFFNISNSVLNIDAITFFNCFINSTQASGNPTIFYDYSPGASVINVKNLIMIQAAASQINLNFTMFLQGAPGSGATNLNIDGMRLADSGGGNLTHMSFDAHMPQSASAFLIPTQAQNYEYGISGSILNKGVFNVSAAYTHYGQLTNAVIILAATGSYTVTLADKMGATGTQFPPYGSTVTFLRPSYSSGTVTIADAAAGTITTNTSTTTVVCQFTPTVLSPEAGAWVTVTPVT